MRHSRIIIDGFMQRDAWRLMRRICASFAASRVQPRSGGTNVSQGADPGFGQNLAVWGERMPLRCQAGLPSWQCMRGWLSSS